MKSFSIALVLIAMTLSLVNPPAFADARLSSHAQEWRGMRHILKVMGRGQFSAADQKSLLEILDAKSQVEGKSQIEDGKGSFPAVYSPTPVNAAIVGKKQPPHRNPSAF